MSLSIIFSIGKYGGFYARKTTGIFCAVNYRLCLGYVSFDCMTPEIDVYLDKIMCAVEVLVAENKYHA